VYARNAFRDYRETVRYVRSRTVTSHLGSNRGNCVTFFFFVGDLTRFRRFASNSNERVYFLMDLEKIIFSC